LNQVTICMPCYNSQAYVAEALASLQAQTYRHWNLVVVDDGSTDESAAVVEATCPQARLIRSPHRGIGAALNLALTKVSPRRGDGRGDHAPVFPQRWDGRGDHAPVFPEMGNGRGDHAEVFPEMGEGRGDHAEVFPEVGEARGAHAEVFPEVGNLLAWIDADDLWLPSKLEVQVESLARHLDWDGCFVGVEQFRQDEGCQRPTPLPGGRHRGALLIRRQAFDRVGAFREDLEVGEFVDWCARAQDAGLRLGELDEVLYRRRIHGQNTVLRKAGQARDYLRVLKMSLDRKRQS